MLLRAAKTPPGPAPGAATLDLSAREKEILALVAQGERDEDIAQALFISVRTVRSHLDRIRDKTGRRRRPDLTRLAVERGLVE
jgi:DNA-binding CsgD family transcriptional regulator